MLFIGSECPVCRFLFPLSLLLPPNSKISTVIRLLCHMAVWQYKSVDLKLAKRKSHANSSEDYTVSSNSATISAELYNAGCKSRFNSAGYPYVCFQKKSKSSEETREKKRLITRNTNTHTKKRVVTSAAFRLLRSRAR